MDLYRDCLRPLLFRLDPERAHEAGVALCRVLAAAPFGARALRGVYGFEDERLALPVAGLDFPNPVGLGAGFDKNARAVRTLAALGFGFVEIGSVSEFPSEGNRVRPRLFRLAADEALGVYYGVPNDGAEAVSRRLAAIRAARLAAPIGVSLVETNTGAMAPIDAVIDEFSSAARRFVGLADYLALNLNCPNSAGGRSHFQDAATLRLLLERFGELARELPLPPVFLKAACRCEPGAIDAVLEACAPHEFVKGFIVSDHAGDRSGMKTPREALARMPGTITGPMNLVAANEAIRTWYARIDRRRHALIGVGGIACAEDAYRFIRSGASLVQLVTALVYRGPGLIADVKRGLLRLIARDGLASIAEAIGCEA